MRTSFITPIIKRKLVAPLHISPLLSSHPYYDVVAVSTYGAYWAAGYWLGENRKDVPVVAAGIAMLWHYTLPYNPYIFYYLWLIGGLSHLIRTTNINIANSNGASKFHLGIQFGGYISFILMMVDLIDVIIDIL